MFENSKLNNQGRMDKETKASFSFMVLKKKPQDYKIK